MRKKGKEIGVRKNGKRDWWKIDGRGKEGILKTRTKRKWQRREGHSIRLERQGRPRGLFPFTKSFSPYYRRCFPLLLHYIYIYECIYDYIYVAPCPSSISFSHCHIGLFLFFFFGASLSCPSLSPPNQLVPSQLRRFTLCASAFTARRDRVIRGWTGKCLLNPF